MAISTQLSNKAPTDAVCFDIFVYCQASILRCHDTNISSIDSFFNYFQSTDKKYSRNQSSRHTPRHYHSFSHCSQSNLLCSRPSIRHRRVVMLLAPHLSFVRVYRRCRLWSDRPWLLVEVRLLCLLPILLVVHVVISIYCRCRCPIRLLCLLAVRRLCLPVLLAVMQDDVESVDYTWNVSQKAEQDVDEDVHTTAAAEENCDGWEEDGEDDDTDIRARHVRENSLV